MTLHEAPPQLDERPVQIEIAYAQPHRAIVKKFQLKPGSSIADALHQAALDPAFSAVNLMNSAVGIFGRLTAHDQVVKEGDRLEIYRPLSADPKAARRARAQQARRKT